MLGIAISCYTLVPPASVRARQQPARRDPALAPAFARRTASTACIHRSHARRPKGSTSTALPSSSCTTRPAAWPLARTALARALQSAPQYTLLHSGPCPRTAPEKHRSSPWRRSTRWAASHAGSCWPVAAVWLSTRTAPSRSTRLSATLPTAFLTLLLLLLTLLLLLLLILLLLLLLVAAVVVDLSLPRSKLAPRSPEDRYLPLLRSFSLPWPRRARRGLASSLPRVPGQGRTALRPASHSPARSRRCLWRTTAR
mmetsp:Transcript_19852/g.56753  ORF Transcript_19852/g.56753 Transcript_19852/m.56753 type:complete len:255 (-) Transcript_19852:688-1452(-)